MELFNFDKIQKHVRTSYPKLADVVLPTSATLAEVTAAYNKQFKKQSEEYRCLVS